MTDFPPNQPPLLPVLPIDPEPGAGRIILRFFIGFFLGLGISILAWIIGWERLSNNKIVFPIAVAVVPLVKIVSAVVALCIKRWRLFGVGMLISIAIGTLIFGLELVGEILKQCKVI